MSVTSDFWKVMNDSSSNAPSGSSVKNAIAPVKTTSTTKKKKKSVSDDFWDAMNNDDIAPVRFTAAKRDSTVAERVDARAKGKKKDEEEKDDRKWYQKGHFEDGYDFGDLTKTILGISDDTASLKDLTVNSLKRGYYNSLYGEESYAEMLGEKNQKDEYKKLLESDEYQFAPGNDFASGISGAMELIGQQARQFTNPRTLAFTGSAVGAAILAGNAGPQALVPEEIISVPAVATAAFKASSAASNFEIEAGHAYNEMIEMGISEDTAKKIALGVGAGNAGLELVQLDELVDAWKVTSKSGATKSVAKMIYDEILARGGDLVKETVQEDIQEGITIGGVQAAHKLDKGEWAYTADEVKDRLVDTTKSSLLSFGLMNVPATAKNTYSIIKDNQIAPIKTVQNEEPPIVEQKPQVEQETKPKVEGVNPVTEIKSPEKKVLYTGSPNTDIKQFKVGGVDGSKQTGDRYGRGVYLTTNESTAKNYAGDSGRVYQIDAGDLNIFNLNDTITPEMRDSLIAVFKDGDKQFRNSMLRNFRTEMTFNDFESAEAFFDHQRKVWKEQDGEYSANKPEIKEADNETGRAVIEFTDYENWENNIGTLTGNHLYDALKSLSTDDFSSFITGHGFDGIAFDEDADNQQYVIYRNEDRLHIDDGTETQQTVSEMETADAPTNEEFSSADKFVSEMETSTEDSEIQKLRDERQVLQDTIMSRVEVNQVDETTEMLAQKWTDVDKQIRSLEAQETKMDESNPSATQEPSTTQQAEPSHEAYVQRLRDELQSLKDNLDAQPDYDSFKVTLDAQRGRMEQLQHDIGVFEERTKASESARDTSRDVSSDIPDIDPSAFSEQIGSAISEMAEEDSSVETSGFEKTKHYVVGNFHVVRRLSPDGERFVFNVSYGENYRTGTSDKENGEFYSHVANAMDSLLYESAGLKQPLYGYEPRHRNDSQTSFVEDTEEHPVIAKDSAIPAEAPVRVVHNEDGDVLESVKSSGEQKWQTQNKTIPRQPKVLTEQPPAQTKQKPGATKNTDGKTADTQPKVTDRLDVEHKKMSPLKWLGEYVVDHGFWVERLSKKTGNRELDARWNFIRYSRGGAQHLIGKGSEANGVKSLKSMLNRVDKAGLAQDFYNYMYHYLNYDRMTVEDRYPNSRNIGVFGDMVSAADSLERVQQYEQAHPEFKEWAEDVYVYNRFLRQKRVEAGLISQKTADLWEEMIPHYVPIRRSSFAETSYEDTGRNASFDSSVHRFEGSDKDILPLFDTMAQATMEVYRATAMNGFASELYNTLYPGYAKNGNGKDVPVDFYLEGFDPRDELLEIGELGSLPTLSFYQNGKRHTFDINSEMYESLKPASDWLSYKAPVISDFSNLRRALITEYNPWFVLKNAIKDVQDIVINSQHPLETYANLVAKAPLEMATNGRYYQEYLENGGNQNTYFDKENVSYDTDKGLKATLKKVTGLDAISKANNIVEMLPRFSEYIASREAGRSIEESMLDASRVTTNFAAGGKFTKLLNRNGATFLNASVQGFVQQARNIVEAKENGLKGWASLAARYAVAGIPVFVLNNLIWEDDEEYKELPDYITNNYYIVGKYGDGKFFRLPKGRTAAVIQNAVEQVAKMSSGDDEADWNEFFKLFIENIAPNNPGEDNVFAPIKQVIKNETWYGEDLVPTRLQDLPVTEQYDEKTDDISIWLSEKLQGIPGLKNLELSPKQINYLLDQYSGVVGDTVLPFHTPKAESPSDSLLGKLVSPLRDIFTTDSVLNNRVTGDFYDTLEAAEAQAESDDASMSDKLRSGILISANVEISKLMKEQREIQTSDLPDSEKYQRNRELKEEINALQKDALDSLKSVFNDGVYAEAGDKRFNYSEEDDTWREVKPELANGEDNWYYIQEQLSHDKLGMSYADFWNGRKPPSDFEGKTYYGEFNGKRYNYDVEDNSWYEIKPKKKNGEDNPYYQKEQLAHDKLGVSYEDFWNNREAYMDAVYVADRWDEPFYETAKNVFGAEHFADIASGMADISADKDANGNPISGTRKRKMEDYIYGLDIPDIEKHILFKSQYSYTKKHNYEIIDYLNEREDISYEEMESILKELGFRVDSEGYITW